MTTRFRLLGILVVSLLAACAHQQAFGVHVEPIDQYRGYGEYHPVSEDQAIIAKARTADPTGKTIHLFQEALPPGIEMHDGSFGVATGYKHHLFGKYAFSTGQEVSKDTLVLQVKKMCVALGANAAIILFQVVPNDHQDRAQAIEAIIVNLDEPPAGES